MKNKNITERFGGLIKEEPLTCLEEDFLLPNTCVMESVSPFFGYYDQAPATNRPQYLYCALNGYYSFETITRATQNIRKKFPPGFDAVTGNITLYGITSQVIRIRNLEQYHQINSLQKLYIEEGINFRKKSRNFNREMTMIKLRKFFYLEEAGNDIFIDRAVAHHAYFAIPRQLDWNQFKEITTQVKYDPNHFYFDGALAFIYEDGEIRDLVRIYREKFNIDEIRSLKEKYLKEINRIKI